MIYRAVIKSSHGPSVIPSFQSVWQIFLFEVINNQKISLILHQGWAELDMGDGGVDITLIESRQHKMGQIADFLPLLASSVFDMITSN